MMKFKEGNIVKFLIIALMAILFTACDGTKAVQETASGINETSNIVNIGVDSKGDNKFVKIIQTQIGTGTSARYTTLAIPCDSRGVIVGWSITSNYPSGKVRKQVSLINPESENHSTSHTKYKIECSNLEECKTKMQNLETLIKEFSTKEN